MGRTKREAPEAADPKVPAKAAKTGKAAASGALAIAADPLTQFAGSPNSHIWAHLSRCDAKIRDHYGDKLTGAPTDFSGVPSYNKSAAQATLASSRPYVASVPLFWLNLMYEPQPGVPKHARRIDALEAHFFEDPNPLPDPIVVILSPGELPHKLIGALRSIDPPEPREALRQAVANAIDRKAGSRILDGWGEILMSCVMRFEVAEDKNHMDILFKHIVQKREDIVKKKETMFVTTLQRIYEIMEFKKALETTAGRQSKDALAKRYETIKFAEGTEPVKPKYIETASTVYNSVLNVPEIKTILFAMDNEASNPLDSVYKLRELAVSCDKKPANMIWCFAMCQDYWNQKKADIEGISVAAFKDTAACSLPRLWLWKRSLRDYLWRQMDVQFPLWESGVRSEIRRLTDSLASWRAAGQLGQGGSPGSTELFLFIFDVLVFGYAHDEKLIEQLKNRRSIEDILELKDFKHFLQRVTAAYAQENGEEVDTGEAEDEQTAEATAARLVTEASVSANLSVAEQLLLAVPEDERQTSDKAAKLSVGIRIAERRVQAQVALLVDSDDANALASNLKATLASQSRGDVEQKRYVAIILDAKVLCESGSQAKYRVPPTRNAQVKRLLDAVLSTRPEGDLEEADILVGLDGGKAGEWEDAKVLQKYLPSKRYGCMKETVIYTYDSVVGRLERASKQPLELTESVYYLNVAKEFAFKVQPRLHTSGSTRGNVIGPLARPELTDASQLWLVPYEQKKRIVGAENLPLPGGSCPTHHEAEKKRTSAAELLPTFWHEGPWALTEEIAHALCPAAILDLSPGGGHFAMYAIRHRVPYTGIVLTQEHQECLRKRLVSRTITGMCDHNDKVLFDSAFAEDRVVTSPDPDFFPS